MFAVSLLYIEFICAARINLLAIFNGYGRLFVILIRLCVRINVDTYPYSALSQLPK